MRGNSISQNGLLFSPVIRATSQQSMGNLSGSVHADTPTGAPVAGATIEVLKGGSSLSDTNGDDVVRSGMTDATGNFTLSFLRPGTYVVRWARSVVIVHIWRVSSKADFRLSDVDC